MNKTLLSMLGPFARAIFVVLTRAEMERKDRLEVGSRLQPWSNPLGHFAGSLLVFRGVALSPAVV